MTICMSFERLAHSQYVELVKHCCDEEDQFEAITIGVSQVTTGNPPFYEGVSVKYEYKAGNTRNKEDAKKLFRGLTARIS